MSAAVADQFEPTSTTSLGELVPLSMLHSSPLNPRKRFDPDRLAELQANIEKHGVIVPLLVRRRNGSSEVIDGERRYRAARSSSLTQVPCVFRDELTDGEVIEIQLLSAIQRQDLTPLEEAAGFHALIDSNPSLYSAGYIAGRVGRSERWVWDRMQLLHLSPALQAHLDADRILVGHAEVLAKLKQEDQLRASAIDTGGLWQGSLDTLDFDEGDGSDPWRGWKTRTVKELEAWIARHIRFDPHHAAITAPLDFGPVFDRVSAALEKPGRGKKVVPITFEHAVHPDAKSDERTFGQSAWARADGRDKESPVCECSVLGTVVAGRHYGQAFEVCIAKDKCHVHWREEIKARAKNDQLRARGQGRKAAQNEVVDQAKAAQQRAEREQQRQDWEKLEILLDAEAIAQVKKVKVLTPAHAKFIGDDCEFYGITASCEKHLGSKWYLQPAAAWLVAAICARPAYGTTTFDAYLTNVVKRLGLKREPFDAIAAALSPKKAPISPSATKAKAAKKAKQR